MSLTRCKFWTIRDAFRPSVVPSTKAHEVIMTDSRLVLRRGHSFCSLCFRAWHLSEWSLRLRKPGSPQGGDSMWPSGPFLPVCEVWLIQHGEVVDNSERGQGQAAGRGFIGMFHWVLFQPNLGVRQKYRISSNFRSFAR